MSTFTARRELEPPWRKMRKPTTPLASLLPGYFAARHDLSPKTERTYRDQFTQFERWCVQRPGRDGQSATGAILADLDPETVDEFKAHRWKHGIRPGRSGSEHQAARAVIALKSLATYFADRRIWHDEFGRSVLRTVSVPQSDAERARLSTEDFAKVLAAVERTAFPDRDRAIVYLLAGNGPREKELVRLQLQHYDRNSGVIAIPARGTKGRPGYRRGRELPLDELVRAELDRYVDEARVGPDEPEAALITTRRGHPFTEQGLYAIFKRLKKATGVAALCPHALRHYWTEHYDGDVLELMRAGGWNSLVMVDRYRGRRIRVRSRTSTLAGALALASRRRTSRKGEGHGDGSGGQSDSGGTPGMTNSYRRR